ncbi:hypothetical protein [uncultured Methanobrevibacter sp.]|nr:hypothetical protein [uncultured Methanobrevibacter sp.]
MAILRSKEIWDMEVDEIQEKLVEELKRTIARVLTILNEKQKEN